MMLQQLIDRFVSSAPKTTMHATNEELSKIFKDERVCPDCGVWKFYEGPSGGMSTNILCGNCGSWFNTNMISGVDRIHEVKIDIDASNYCEFTRDIINNWHAVSINEMRFDIFNWCESNVNSLWSMKWGNNKSKPTFNYYFEEETDVMAFKLRWI